MKTKVLTFDHRSFPLLCRRLAKTDADLGQVLLCHGLPPLWSRPPNFATLIHIILEQQVSLVSAKAAMARLKAKIGRVTPRKLLELSDAEMKACAFSRQKIIYARHLAQAVLSGQLNFKSLAEAPDEQVRAQLTKIKGIGNWTVDVYLMMALHRADCFPTGDIALMKSIREVKNLFAHTGTEKILSIAGQWRPYRTVAAYLLWWAYIRKRNIKL
jgi:DNA-3-methyladenine glycosylase II